MDGLKSVPHFHPFKVPWANSTALGVKHPCFIPFNFHLYFWTTLWHMLGIKLKFFIAFQSQTDGQTEVVNMSLGKSPHEIVYGFRSRQPVNLILMANHYRVFESTSSFATHIHDLHKKIGDKIEQSNLGYKLRVVFGRSLKLSILATL